MLALKHSFADALPSMAVEARGADFPAPQIVVLNEALARDLGLDPTWLHSDDGLRWISGADGGHATAYAGHQFGQFVPLLGDGRALLLGDLPTADGRIEIQLKGSGPTPFSRPGSDGRGALGPMLREYLVSEFMHAVGVPTTRSLAVLTTGETVLRQQGYVPGGIVVRVARSHLRIGSVQYAASRSPELAEKLIDAAGFDAPEDLLATVMARQLDLVAQWMRIGFVHGVLNTDNVALSGETIDYGPCAFTEKFRPAAVFSSIDAQGRYAFGNQPDIMAWNLTRLAEALLPVSNTDAMQEVLADMEPTWHRAWEKHVPAPQALAQADDITTYNHEHHGGPLFIPRNRMLDRAISSAERDGDLQPFIELLTAVTDPYNAEAGPAWMAEPEGDDGEPFITFCGT
ncbi:protein adenylyltransferase SelO family protein [Corynebacterium sp. MSK044]|uniref:protein adenylyltransferase SelO family protein n=1 Tax=unclassified Corynebacterium TaxID=2624378 RepID=UPI002549CE4E|nr:MULTISPECIES: protein adenylyltransferase SelO family protein [unclassified Corynebacterium]MDK8794442.1 protein adenylyltransferase SelO family protein [Corynebacterium sp. MSK041]MDK8797274.1 protein adenylyltransferase SelO family protein [Corynebacterium sp. MSK044]